MAEVEVREAATGGLGVFTGSALSAGEIVRRFELVREVTREDPVRPEEGRFPDHCPLIDGHFWLVGIPDRYFNHSCDPNCYLHFGGDGIEVVARRDVSAGDELTLDYLVNNSGGDSWPCGCGAARCRGETGRSFFELPIELQREYLPLLAPWFRKRHAREVGDLERASRGEEE